MESDEMGLVERLRAKWTDSDSIQLHMGECSAQELRSIKAVAISILSEIKPEAERLVAERDEAREALKPFAEYARLDSGRSEREGVVGISSPEGSIDVTFGDFARARQALGDT